MKAQAFFFRRTDAGLGCGLLSSRVCTSDKFASSCMLRPQYRL